jgi:superfamily I DNA/RNA helicase
MGLRWPALQEAGIATVRIDASDEHKAGPGVRLCTMHRAKGLEFRHVLVAGVGDERFPRPADEPDEDPVAAAWHDARQRSLLFVAATRARETLTVVGWGTRTYP